MFHYDTVIKRCRNIARNEKVSSNLLASCVDISKKRNPEVWVYLNLLCEVVQWSYSIYYTKLEVEAKAVDKLFHF